MCWQVESPKIVCGTIVVEAASKKKRRSSSLEIISDRIASSLYEKCRVKASYVSGFPDFAPLVSELAANASQTPSRAQQEAFKVTTVHASGNLIIQEQFFEQFGQGDIQPDFDKLVETHNERFNTENLRVVVERSTDAPTESREEKMQYVEPGDGVSLTHEMLAGLTNPSDSQKGVKHCQPNYLLYQNHFFLTGHSFQNFGCPPVWLPASWQPQCATKSKMVASLLADPHTHTHTHTRTLIKHGVHEDGTSAELPS